VTQEDPRPGVEFLSLIKTVTVISDDARACIAGSGEGRHRNTPAGTAARALSCRLRVYLPQEPAGHQTAAQFVKAGDTGRDPGTPE
jgi:hypothetical protein